MNTYRGRIDHITRLNSSVNGNPNWLVCFEDGTEIRTSSDSGISYALGNPEYRNAWVICDLTRAGRITNVRVVKREDVTRCTQDATHHSDDIIENYTGYPEPIILCGYHTQMVIQLGLPYKPVSND